MTLPTFLVIGATRSGTSWLYKALKSHPDIYVPELIKEILFFNCHYGKGLAWYEKFFPKQGGEYKAIGEVSADYIVDKQTSQRVKKDLPQVKLIITLRNPVDKVFSSYKNEKLYGKTEDSFEEYIKKRPKTYEKAFYAAQLKRWFALFPKKSFLILLFEETIEQPEEALQKVATFLDVDPKRFDSASLYEKTNKSYTPVFHKLFLLGYRINEYLVENEQYWLSNAVIKLGGLFKLLPKKERGMQPATRRQLCRAFEKDIKETEKLLKRNLQLWREQKERK